MKTNKNNNMNLNNDNNKKFLQQIDNNNATIIGTDEQNHNNNIVVLNNDNNINNNINNEINNLNEKVIIDVDNGDFDDNLNKNNINKSLPQTVILAGSSVTEQEILEKIFKKANKNGDKYLTIQELGHYINKKIHEHIKNSIAMNAVNFAQIDTSPKDGLITWDEYHKYFLREHGLDETYIREHNEAKHLKLSRKAREDMMRDKARWSEAAKTDPFSLTLDEFLAFRHPESSTVNLLGFVDDLLRLFDLDGDDCLTLEEFSDLSLSEFDEKYRRQIVSKTVEARQEEFNRIIDINSDGKADREELLNYVNPKHPRYALQEAGTLVNLTDTNKDGKLTLDEILTNSKIFMASKMVDTANSFHEEF
ncbi:45 kDa calcium-binding protein isoform X2 [Condylostylus longicornis]|nr:45 kDa calcium-binding protein isoform X2 [Condylostylus longicornis]